MTAFSIYACLNSVWHALNAHKDRHCTGVLCVVWVFWARESKTPQGNLAKVYQKRLNQPIEIEIYTTLPIFALQNSIT